ncbi:MAG: hypothetical protein M3Z46_11710 [Actinomycetota bacterium]|nr:hypothetical protein [Actinomycetota bacterium]
MTIEKGGPWGEPGPLSVDGVIVRSDAEACRVIEAARRSNEPVPELGLVGGDLCRTVGGQGDVVRLRGDDAVRLPVDLASVLIDGRLHWFVAHLVARRSWWWGEVFVAMNAEWLGPFDVAPRAHPGDGLLDTLTGKLGFDDRLKVRRRLRSGTHVPHPDIVERRVHSLQCDFARPLDVWLDGRKIGRARTLSLRVEPDALTCVV